MGSLKNRASRILRCKVTKTVDTDLDEPVDGVLVVIAEDGEVTLVEVAAEPAAAAHRREGGDGARVVDRAGEPLDGHRHEAALLAGGS